MSSTVDSMGWPREDDGGYGNGRGYAGDGRPAREGSSSRPGFLAAPFSGRTWRETLQAVLNLPVGVVWFSFAVGLLTAGLGTAVTFVGLPILAVTVACCRGFGAMERARASALLDLEVPAPARRRPDRPGLSALMGAALKDGGGWRAALYGVLMLPLGIVSFTVAVTMWTVAISMASYPLWQWVFPTYVHRPGIQLYENNNHTHYLSTVPQIAGCCAVGLLLLFVTPQLLRGLAGVQRVMVRGLLSR